MTELAKRVGSADIIATLGQTPSKIFFIDGAIQYKDIFFPESPVHHVDWCVLVSPNEPEKNRFSFINVRDEED